MPPPGDCIARNVLTHPVDVKRHYLLPIICLQISMTTPSSKCVKTGEVDGEGNLDYTDGSETLQSKFVVLIAVGRDAFGLELFH